MLIININEQIRIAEIKYINNCITCQCAVRNQFKHDITRF